MGRLVKGLTKSMALSTKRPNKKQKSKFSITEINNQYFRNLLKNFNNVPYICYKTKQVHNEPTESEFFLTKHITKLIKIESHFRPNFVKSDVNKTIVQAKACFDT